MKFALHTSTAISSVLKEPEHFYVDIYYLIILIIVAFTLLLLSFLRYHLYKTKKEKELREIASLVDKNEILIQRYSREMSHIKEQLEAKEKCLKEYQHAAQWMRPYSSTYSSRNGASAPSRYCARSFSCC